MTIEKDFSQKSKKDVNFQKKIGKDLSFRLLGYTFLAAPSIFPIDKSIQKMRTQEIEKLIRNCLS